MLSCMSLVHGLGPKAGPRHLQLHWQLPAHRLGAAYWESLGSTETPWSWAHPVGKGCGEGVGGVLATSLTWGTFPVLSAPSHMGT